MIFAALGPEIKIVITGFAIAGPIAIILLLWGIKKIKEKYPDRIRWR